MKIMIRICKDSLILWYPSSMNMWLLLQFWYRWVLWCDYWYYALIPCNAPRHILVPHCVNPRKTTVRTHYFLGFFFFRSCNVDRTNQFYEILSHRGLPYSCSSYFKEVVRKYPSRIWETLISTLTVQDAKWNSHLLEIAWALHLRISLESRPQWNKTRLIKWIANTSFVQFKEDLSKKQASFMRTSPPTSPHYPSNPTPKWQ